MMTLVALLLAAAPAAAAPSPAPNPDHEMFQVQLAMLRAGPNREETKPDDPRQKAHLDGLEALAKSGKALAVGPIEGDGSLRGIAVLDVGTREEAERLLAQDPWIASGHLVADYRTWFVAKKLFRRPAGAFLDVEPCTFALLVRPPTAPELSPEERTAVQAGHMANIEAMAKAGELAIAGPFVEDTSLRGIFVFRTTDRAKIDALVANDPAVKRGRLKLEPYTWWLSKGVMPAAEVR